MLVATIKRLLSLARRGAGYCRMRLSGVRAILRRQPNYIIQSIDGDDATIGSKVVVFAHFDTRGQVHRYVFHQLEQLKSLGFAILFVSNSEKLQAENMQRLKTLVAKVILRENIGYDFGAYKDGLSTLGRLADYDQLILANDSVYGPFRSLTDALGELDDNPSDVVAITDSWEIQYHLQSYFLCFNNSVLASPKFSEFWRKLKYVDNKHYVVRYYEVGLSQLLLRQQFKCSALFPYQEAARLFFEELSAMDITSDEFKAMPAQNQHYYLSLRSSIDMGVPINGSHFLWEILLGEMRCPFVKRELLNKNPMKVPGLMRLDELIAKQGDYDTSLIRDHLKQVNRGRAY